MFDSIFGIHEQAMQIRSRRQDLLANNLANSDTPNYKARDMEWKKALANVSDSFDNDTLRTNLKKTNQNHLEGFGQMTTEAFVHFRQPTQPSLDGNTVESNIEKAKYMENALQYQATLEFVNGKIRGIRSALRGE